MGTQARTLAILVDRTLNEGLVYASFTPVSADPGADAYDASRAVVCAGINRRGVVNARAATQSGHRDVETPSKLSWGSPTPGVTMRAYSVCES